MNFKQIASPVFHFLFPASCDFCHQSLKRNHFVRVCLHCVIRSLNIKKPVCHFCFHLLIENQCPECNPIIDKEKITGKKEKIYFQRNYSLFFNQGMGQKFIYQYKFFRQQSYAEIIALLICKKYSQLLNLTQAFIPITLGKQGIFERDFCPVTEVVKKLSKLTNIPLIPVLKRNDKYYGKAQHKKSQQARKEEIENKYHYLKKYQYHLNHKDVLLIDDVFTTGSTINYGAKLIKENNTNCRVTSFTFLRTLLTKD